MHRERVWNSVSDRAVRLDHGAHRASPRQKSFDDGVIVVCFLALVGLVVLGGLLMLLSWVTTTLPVNARIACSPLPVWCRRRTGHRRSSKTMLGPTSRS